MTRVTVFVVACILGGCAHQRLPTTYAGTPSVFFEEPTYDGQHISGRLRVEADGGPVIFDGRLIENVTLNLRGVYECESGKELPLFIEDYFPAEPTLEDLVTVKPTYFFGTKMKYLVFPDEPGPDCIEVTFTFHSGVKPGTEEGEAAVRVRFQKAKPGQ